ncbi:glycosyltransferase [Marinilabiliaceae bacterium ANBcel2]|nr:glycosyltransferase [Marinilabiliaceae bacterium ANBcel2]
MNKEKNYQSLLQLSEQKWDKDTIPLVSISSITFNHASYIKDCLDGFLMQKTNFPVEILIHDDASTDGTSDIIKEYQEKYSHLFFPIIQTQNQYSHGIRGMSRRFNYPRARGKYIALCEGDDYWTDPYKLQKQVDFLEANPEYAGAAHQSRVMHQNSEKPESLFRNHIKTVIEMNEVLGDRLFHTASFMFRTEIVQNNTLPSNITAGDRALFMLVAAHGKIHYSNEAMCCYRKNDSGISTWVTTELMEKDLNIVPWIKKIRPDFPKHRYYHFIHYTIMRFPKTITKGKLINHSCWYIYHSFYQFPKNIKQVAIFILYELPQLWLKTKH